MVAEDNADLRELFALWLERAGARVTTTSDGREALDLMVRLVPDVVVCDLHMPGMDGYEVVRQMRDLAGLAGIPVIAVTGSESERSILRTLEAGFAAHLVKPVTAGALSTQVQRVLRTH